MVVLCVNVSLGRVSDRGRCEMYGCFGLAEGRSTRTTGRERLKAGAPRGGWHGHGPDGRGPNGCGPDGSGKQRPYATGGAM